MIRHMPVKRVCALMLACLILMMTLAFVPKPAQAKSSVVRVLLTKLELTDRLEASLDGSYTMNGMSFQRGADVVFSCKTGRLMVYYEGMAFDAGKEVTIKRHQVTDGKENGLRLNDNYNLFCGDLHVSTDGKKLTAVLHIPMEEYLLGVVPYEMSDSFPLEALKAQAIAARTYAMKKMQTGGALYDLVDNTNDQVYYGYNPANEQAVTAVRDTAGIVGYYKNDLAICYYTASNGGQVELVRNVWGPGEGEYITMHDDPYDVENPESVVKYAEIGKRAENGVVYNAQLTEYLMDALSEAVASRGFSAGEENIRIAGVRSISMHTPQDGRDSRVMTQMRFDLVVEARRETTAAATEDEEINLFAVPMTTIEVQSTPQPAAQQPFVALDDTISVDVPVFSHIEPWLGLSINGSNNEVLTVEEKENAFVIASRRYGHGVGMSQRGAQWAAGKYGWTYDQILRFYYPGLTFKKVDTTVALPSPVSAEYLTTPGPAATATPRPTLMPATSELKADEWKVKVTQIGVNSSLNLRAEPNTNSDILRVLYYGQELIAASCDTEGWIRVKTDVIEGYVMEKFVEKTE